MGMSGTDEIELDIEECSPANPPENISSGLVLPSLGFPRILEVDNFKSRFSAHSRWNRISHHPSLRPRQGLGSCLKLTSNNASLSSALHGRTRGENRLRLHASDGNDLNRPDSRSRGGSPRRSDEGSGEHGLRRLMLVLWMNIMHWVE